MIFLLLFLFLLLLLLLLDLILLTSLILAAKWMIKPGQKLSPGDHICDIETDKATIAWEAQEEGYVAKMLVRDPNYPTPVSPPTCKDGAYAACCMPT
jgi:hypothetical protein